jgi:hypothetical protein
MWPIWLGFFFYAVNIIFGANANLGLLLMTQAQTTQDDDLEYSREMRRRLVESMIENGAMPTDPKDRTHFLMALDGLDRAALGKMRIQTDKDIGSAQAAAAGVLAELFKDPRVTKIGIGQRDSAPILDADIAPTRVLDGELSNARQSDNYDSFMKRTDAVEETVKQ